MPLAFLVNNFNHKKKTVIGVGGKHFKLGEYYTCKELKEDLEENMEKMWNAVGQRNARHDSWNLYGRGTHPSVRF